MARIYRTTDKISYKIGEIEIKISPLSVHDKAILHDYITRGQSGDSKILIEGSMFAIKAALKEVSGLEDSDGNPYQITFDDNNYVTQNCIDDLMNIQESNTLITLCSQLIAGIPNKLPEGVSLADSPKKNAKPKG